jgi:hypothetical protein
MERSKSWEKRGMRIPVVRGVIDRRILINYRIRPGAAASILPRPFRPKIVGGYAIGGVCLIRLAHIRPRPVPRILGLDSENAAHRIAVEWDHNGELREGVFISRRDTSSRINELVGGRLFPGAHHHARFLVDECDTRYRLTLNSDDGVTHVLLDAHVADAWTQNSVFRSLPDASAFFERGSLGYSVHRQRGRFDGLELRAFNWSVMPLAVDKLESNYFQNPAILPADAVELDCALLMRNVEHEWHARDPIWCV